MKIALELKHMGMQLTDIARITELSVDEIAGL
jgi:hypothetical protein